MDPALERQPSDSLAQRSANEASDGSMEAMPSTPPEQDVSYQSRPGIIETAQSDNPPTQQVQHNEPGMDIDMHSPSSNNGAPVPELRSVTNDVQPTLHMQSPLPLNEKNETSPQDMDRREANEDPYASRKHDERVETDSPTATSVSSVRESDASVSSEEEEDPGNRLTRMRMRDNKARLWQIPHPAMSRVSEAKRGVRNKNSYYDDTVVPVAPYDPRPYTRSRDIPDYPPSRPPPVPKTYGAGSRTKPARRPKPSSKYGTGHAKTANDFYGARPDSWPRSGRAYSGLNPPTGNVGATNASISESQQNREYRYIPPRTAGDPLAARLQLPAERNATYHEGLYEDLYENDSLYSEELDVVEEEQLPYSITAELNYVGWQQFKYIREHPRGDHYVIDILTEEPDVAFTENMNVDDPLFRRMMTIGRYSAQVPKVDSAAARGENKPSVPKQFAPGQGPLPERIRINSESIISILSKIIGGPALRPDEPLVIVRPFKALVQHEDELRAWAKKLSQKYPDEISDPNSEQQESMEQILPQDCTTASGDPNDSGRPTTIVPVEEEVADKDVRKDQNPGENLKAENKDASTPGDIAQGEIETDPTDSRVALEHLRRLLEFIDKEINAKVQHIENSRSQKVYFSDIWYLFKPGDEVIEQAGRQAYRVINVQSVGHMVLPAWASWGDRVNIRSKEKMTLTLTCVSIDFDGVSLGPVQEIFTISRFDGQRPITSLPVYPLRFYAREDARDRLIARGKMFPDLVSIKHASYSGLTLDNRDDVDGQVVIDFEEAVVVKREWKPYIENFVGLTAEDRNSKESCTAECCSSEVVLDDFYVERNRHDDFVASLIPQRRDHLPSLVIFPRPISEIKNSENRITDGEFLIMSHRVFGFVLHSRKWGESLQSINISLVSGQGVFEKYKIDFEQRS